jgi:hypothetical protein
VDAARGAHCLPLALVLSHEIKFSKTPSRAPWLAGK